MLWPWQAAEIGPHASGYSCWLSQDGRTVAEESYLRWLVENTATSWWHDSADPAELDEGLSHKASGVTTNPILAFRSLCDNREFWASKVPPLPDLPPEQRGEALLKCVVQETARKLAPQYEDTEGRRGYVCAQVNPLIAADRQAMKEMAKRFSDWAPNIAVKLPAAAAGLDALEDCVAEGITITSTVSHAVPQVIAIAERHRRGAARARQAGRKPGRCFAVIMIGRLDDYLQDLAEDRKTDVSVSDIQQAGLAVSKRAHAIYRERGYEATLLVAALRGTYHMVELAGAELIMSIHPRYQKMLLAPGVPREERIGVPVPDEVIERLSQIPEFVSAYEPDGMAVEEFFHYGLFQRTLTQFHWAGWARIESAVIS